MITQDTVHITISPDSLAPARALTAGDTVCFTLAARASSGEVIRNYNESSDTVIVRLMRSTANTDTSNQTWNSDPEGYSYAELLGPSATGPFPRQSAPHEWRILASWFEGGIFTVCFKCTKAERDLYLEVSLLGGGTKRSSGRIEFKVGRISNYLVEITGQNEHWRPAVYMHRKFEIMIVPRDRHLNWSAEEIATSLTARFPGEFSPESQGMFGTVLLIEVAFFSTIRRRWSSSSGNARVRLIPGRTSKSADMIRLCSRMP